MGFKYFKEAVKDITFDDQLSFYEILCIVLTHDRMRALTEILGIEFYRAIEIIEESRFDLDASSDQLRMGDKVYSFDDHDCFECFQFKCDANSCPHHIGTVYILWRAVYPE